jgi:hypothetical protein
VKWREKGQLGRNVKEKAHVEDLATDGDVKVELNKAG